MALTRVATWKRPGQGKAALLVVDGKKIEIDHAQLPTLDTATKLKAEIERQASVSNVKLPRVFVHINRDGSIALATGTEPEVWPEDEPDKVVISDVVTAAFRFEIEHEPGELEEL